MLQKHLVGYSGKERAETARSGQNGRIYGLKKTELGFGNVPFGKVVPVCNPVSWFVKSFKSRFEIWIPVRVEGEETWARNIVIQFQSEYQIREILYKGKDQIAWKQLWRPEGRQLSDMQQFVFILVNSKLLNLLSCLPIGLQTGYSINCCFLLSLTRLVQGSWYFSVTH